MGKQHSNIWGLAFVLLIFLAMAEESRSDFRENFIDPADGYFDASRYLSENAFGFLPVPIIITDPALDGGLGVMGLFFHESEEQEEKR